MNCSDVQKYTFLYLDSEFGESERRELECHLAACPPCHSMIEGSAHFRRALRHHLRTEGGAVQADASMRCRLQERLATCEPGGAKAPLRALMALAAGIGVCFVGWQLWPLGGSDGAQIGPQIAAAGMASLPATQALVATRPPRRATAPVAVAQPAAQAMAPQPALVPVAAESDMFAEAEVLAGAVDNRFLTERSPFGAVRTAANLRSLVRAHVAPLPLEVRGGGTVVRTWLTERVPGAAGPPISEGAGVTLQGARLSQLAGRPVVLYAYTAFGKAMTVVQHLRVGRSPFDEPDVEQHQPGEPGLAGALVDHFVGFQVLHALREGQLLTVISELDVPALRGIVEPPTFL